MRGAGVAAGTGAGGVGDGTGAGTGAGAGAADGPDAHADKTSTATANERRFASRIASRRDTRSIMTLVKRCVACRALMRIVPKNQTEISKRKNTGEPPACKPGSVGTNVHARAHTPHRMVIPLGVRSPERSSSLPAARHPRVPLSRRAVSHRLFGLAPTGVCRATAVTSGAVGSYPTVSPLPRRSLATAVCFLLHCPSCTTHAVHAQALPGSLPCGARTFLEEPTRTLRRASNSSRPSGRRFPVTAI